MATCKSLLEEDCETSYDDVVCVVCLEPLNEGRRFNCFHLLCSDCAERHVAACLSLTDGERLAFGPVFCPQCREVTYVWPEEGYGLPICASVADARAESQRILDGLKANENTSITEDAAATESLRQAATDLEKDIAEAMVSVRELLKEECEMREELFKWACDEDLVSRCAAFKQLGWVRPVEAMNTLREEFGDELKALLNRRANLTPLLERLFLRKWVLNTLQNHQGSVSALAIVWADFEANMKSVEEAKDHEDDEKGMEVEDETSEDLFLLSAIFRSHRPYPGAVLPEQRVKPGQIRAQCLWSSGARGAESHNFDWPIHAIFLDGTGNGRIAVADKGNKRVKLLDATTGKYLETLKTSHLTPRRIFRHRTRDGRDLLLISDELNGLVKAFSMDTWEPEAKFGQGLFLCPTGVCEKSDGTLVYSDMDRGIVSFHNGDSLQLIQKWTCRLLGDRYLPSPSFVAVDADDFIFVSDSQNSCVKIFNQLGGIVSQFGYGMLQCPRGIAVDPLGHVFVVDSDNHRICVFNPHGKFLQEVVIDDVVLEYPMSLDYLPKEQLLLVTQCSFTRYNHSVFLFKIEYDGNVAENSKITL